MDLFHPALGFISLISPPLYGSANSAKLCQITVTNGDFSKQRMYRLFVQPNEKFFEKKRIIFAQAYNTC
ncbi:MAG: hypothetical protein DI535_05450 [Citrobacter freundii]|nr:MAG: hypothetical protein DI535_05450 [Citrobacter freundii]